MEWIILLEFLKWALDGFEIVVYFRHRKREKALIQTVEKLNQRLISLEKSVKKLN